MKSSVTVPAPAKVNLSLAVTGRRADGFHELVSVVAPLAWGDEVVVEGQKSEVRGRRSEVRAEGEEDRGQRLEAGGRRPEVRGRKKAVGGGADLMVSGEGEGVPAGEDNLVLKAAREFRGATGWEGEARFELKKRIPVGAGLGGGSSDAAAALRGLNEIAGKPLEREKLMAVAARVGSDCALFLFDGPVVMRGRGERVEALAEKARARLSGRRVLVFKPALGISTAWAYRRIAQMDTAYASGEAAERRLAKWIASDGAAEELLCNTLERPAFEKFPALPLMLERLRGEFGVAAGMSGSGSACFALLRDDSPVARMEAAIREAWGKSAFVRESRLA